MMLELSPLEKDAARAFLLRPECKRALAAGGQVAIVYGPYTGIGIPIEITVRHPDGEVYRQNITDYGTW